MYSTRSIKIKKVRPIYRLIYTGNPAEEGAGLEEAAGVEDLFLPATGVDEVGQPVAAGRGRF